MRGGGNDCLPLRYRLNTKRVYLTPRTLVCVGPTMGQSTIWEKRLCPGVRFSSFLPLALHRSQTAALP